MTDTHDDVKNNMDDISVIMKDFGYFCHPKSFLPCDIYTAIGSIIGWFNSFGDIDEKIKENMMEFY